MTLWPNLLDAPAPTVAVGFAANRISVASLESRAGRAIVGACASEKLPAGALVPSLTNQNVHDRPAVLDTLGRVFEQIGGRPQRIGAVVPDLVAKVSLVRFEHVPPRQQDLDQLVRWQVRKTAPFAIEEAQISYMPGLRADDGQEYVVSIARRDVVAEYESLCEAVGAHAGIVDVAAFNLINAILAGSAPPLDDWLLIHVTGESASTAILRGDRLIFFRNRGADVDESLFDLVHQAAMYYEDRLEGRGFARVILAGLAAAGSPSSDIEQAQRRLEERVNHPVELLDPRESSAFAERISASPALLDALAPLVGLLSRDWNHAHAAR
jgi:Tfp pilus assembly PilM family ATPase